MLSSLLTYKIFDLIILFVLIFGVNIQFSTVIFKKSIWVLCFLKRIQNWSFLLSSNLQCHMLLIWQKCVYVAERVCLWDRERCLCGEREVRLRVIIIIIIIIINNNNNNNNNN